MGKICIVKRRKREDQCGFGPAEDARLYVLEKPELEALKTSDGSSLVWSRPALEDATGAEEQKFSMELTPTQAEVVKSHAYFKLLLGAEPDGSGVNVERSEDGNIIFNFYFKQVHFARMLTSADVCNMLQISKTFLSRLVKVGRFKSRSEADAIAAKMKQDGYNTKICDESSCQ